MGATFRAEESCLHDGITVSKHTFSSSEAATGLKVLDMAVATATEGVRLLSFDMD